MLTYDFENVDGPIYLYVYKRIKQDILDGILHPGEKLPSKRSFADHNGVSTITIQNAYDQLISEGYVYTLAKKGYYVANITGMARNVVKTDITYDIRVPETKEYPYDLSKNGIDVDHFPFSVWTKVSREVMSQKKKELMEVSLVNGVRALREAIAEHLQSFRGMMVDPNQIVVGAGTEYLYGIIIQLLGKKHRYVLEDPGYHKLGMIYGQYGVECSYAALDEAGVSVEELQKSGGDIAHICPNHHFPTGITMPATRRYEILAWANEKEDRYIIEDDYDSEFRAEGKPIPTLFSIDGCEKVIYMNTFSKSLSPTIRISYMVLPVHLTNIFFERMSFYSCTVSNFEQYTLAEFMGQGYFEKHINRMKLYYSRQRKRVMETIAKSSLGKLCEIVENDSGLHFLIRIQTELEDQILSEKLEARDIKLRSISEYDQGQRKKDTHLFIINYSNLQEEKLSDVMEEIAVVVSENRK